jgi:hypothetical protein
MNPAKINVIAYHHRFYFADDQPPLSPTHPADPSIVPARRDFQLRMWIYTDTGWRKIVRTLPPKSSPAMARENWQEFRGWLCADGKPTMKTTLAAVQRLKARLKKGEPKP